MHCLADLHAGVVIEAVVIHVLADGLALVLTAAVVVLLEKAYAGLLGAEVEDDGEVLGLLKGGELVAEQAD